MISKWSRNRRRRSVDAYPDFQSATPTTGISRWLELRRNSTSGKGSSGGKRFRLGYQNNSSGNAAKTLVSLPCCIFYFAQRLVGSAVVRPSA